MLTHWMVRRGRNIFILWHAAYSFITHEDVLLLFHTLLLWSNNWGSRWMLVRDPCWIDSLIVLVMLACSRIRVLVEVHQYVLDLRLFWWIHYHHNRLRRRSTWGHRACVCLRLVMLWNEFVAAPEIGAWRSIVSIEGLWSRTCPSLFRWLLLSTHKTPTSKSSWAWSWGLSLRSSLLLLLLYLLLMVVDIVIWCKVSMSSVLVMLVCVSCINVVSTCRKLCVLIHKLLTKSKKLQIFLSLHV